MGIKLLKQSNNDKRFIFFCPGCKCGHYFDTSIWTWNGSFDKPTVRASIKVDGTEPITDDEHARIMAGEKIVPRKLVCHSFVTDGRIEFLSDCTHVLKGQTIELPDWD